MPGPEEASSSWVTIDSLPSPSSSFSSSSSEDSEALRRDAMRTAVARLFRIPFTGDPEERIPQGEVYPMSFAPRRFISKTAYGEESFLHHDRSILAAVYPWKIAYNRAIEKNCLPPHTVAPYAIPPTDVLERAAKASPRPLRIPGIPYFDGLCPVTGLTFHQLGYCWFLVESQRAASFQLRGHRHRYIYIPFLLPPPFDLWHFPFVPLWVPYEKRRVLMARDYQTILTHGRLFHLPQRWELIRPLGQGAYGLVISVKDTLSGEPVAVKCITKVFDKVILAKRALREITLLRHFAGHENITGLIDLDNVWHGYNEVYLYMEPMEADLHQIVRSGQPLSNTHIQYFLYQLLRGMKYIHTADVIHRDLKPGNLLVNSDCELKICDFGLARGYRPVTGEQDQNEAMRLTEYVATRWYRAPEIMLSNERYTTAIDIWSIGCILAELIGGKPCFKGKDYIDQLNLILGVLGTPDMSTLNKVASEKAAAYIRSLPILPPKPWASILPDTVDPDALDLLDKLLAFDPESRVSATDALSHPYMAQYHDPLDEPSHPEKFGKWEEVESLDTIEDLRSAITREIEEFREEVRNFGVYSDADEEEEQEILADSASASVSGQVAMTRSPIPVEQVSPKDTVRAQLGVGLSPTMATKRLPGAVGSPSTPATALSEDSAVTFSSSAGPPPSATVGPSGSGSGSGPAPKKRSSSGYSMSRRPTSFLFSPLGYGMTPLPSLLPPEPSGSIGTTPAEPPTANMGGMGGRKSRQSSSTIPDAGSLRPLIRQLSTVNFHGASHGNGDDKEEEGEVPPMTVSPSDAPPSEVPRTQREASFAL